MNAAAERARRLLLPLAVFLAAAALVVGHSIFLEVNWLRPSRQSPLPGRLGVTQWGGSKAVAAAQPQSILLDNDCYYWIRYAQQMLREGTARVRRTDLDNVPYGREVHWAAPLSWWAIGMGALRRLFVPGALTDQIAAASVWANPVLLLVWLALLIWMLRRKLGLLWAAALVLAYAAIPSVLWDFGYGRLDHHGLHSMSALGMLLCLVLGGAGWTGASVAPRSARRWFAASSAFGAFGLWVGATEQAIVLATAGLGAFLAMIFWGRADGAEQPDGTLWRLWGWTGAALSLLFYAIEYVPHHMAMRLEVNHPLYAVTWAAGGEVLARTARLRRGEGARRDVVALTAAVLATAILPLALFFGPRTWHALHDPIVRRIHDFIVEFQPLVTAQGKNVLVSVWRTFNLFPLILLCVPAALLVRRLPARARAGMLIAGLPSLSLAGWALFQVRWGGFFSATLLSLAAASLPPLVALLDQRWPRYRWRVALVVLLCVPPLTVYAFNARISARAMRDGRMPLPLARAVAGRDLALNLQRYGQLGPLRVMCGAGETPALHFFGDGRGVSSLYWENGEGLRDEAEFFADFGDETAREIARKRGLTHVVVQATPALAE